MRGSGGALVAIFREMKCPQLTPVGVPKKLILSLFLASRRILVARRAASSERPENVHILATYFVMQAHVPLVLTRDPC